MHSTLKGKRALVTGASKGIGFAVAEALLAEGARVLICGREQSRIDAAVARLKKIRPEAEIFGAACDVGHYDQVATLFKVTDEIFSGLDVLVNNAGFGTFRSVAEFDVQEWNRLIATNLSGAFYCSREALARFKKAEGGHIINISSLAGKNPFAGGAAYNASKFGMNGFSEAMMLDHRADNVRVSYVMPGSVDTEFSGRPAEQRSSWKISPEDIADIVLGILKMPGRTLISRVEVRPSRPQKD